MGKTEEPKPSEIAADGAKSATIRHNPLYRNAVHLGAFLVFGFPLSYIANPANHIQHGKAIVVGFFCLVTILNIVLLPRLPSGKIIARPGEDFVTGQWLYPLSLAICYAILPVYDATAAWAVMATGDAAASFCGRNIKSPKLPWNRAKSFAGLAGFCCAALPMVYLSLWLCPDRHFLTRAGPPEVPFVWTLSVLAVITGALLESLDTTLDDNIRVPLGTGIVLWGAGTFLSYATRNLPANTPVQPERFITALAVNAAAAGALASLKFVDIPGAILGGCIGAIIYFFTGWQGYALMLLFVACGSLLSKVGVAKKNKLGVAEDRGGKRGAGNVAANLAVAALCCLAFPSNGGDAAWLLAMAGALAAAFADTAASEIGVLAGGQPFMITTLKSAPHGTNGAISWLGMFASLIACGIMALAAWQTGYLTLVLGNARHAQGVGMVLIIIAGMAGSAVDSLLGATVEDRYFKGNLGKGVVNFACTMAGAAVAGGGWLLYASMF